MQQESHIHKAREALKKHWGYDGFRPGQEDAISAVLQGRETLVLFPTGGGKSLCYQVPALVLEGLTVVISPLIALMQDQVEQLGKNNIRAAYINSTLPASETEQRLVNARNGMYRLLYIAPERLASDRWKAELQNLNISLIAVDEAHCISEWGHDFRPAYRHIRNELSELPEQTRWMALTATATPEVKQDILQSLGFKEPAVITAGFSRPNLKWWVTETDKKKEVFLKAVRKAVKKGSGIVYTDTRKDCEQKAAMLTSLGIHAKAYHAGLEPKIREKVQNDWVSGSVAVVVATNAFGMGIDKSDCRFVIHHTMPFSLEAYYQEAGRAGRDGEEAYPILIFKETDEPRLKSRILRSYPQYETLRKVYDGICDELELATGSEHPAAEPVNLNAVAKRTGVPVGEIRTSVQILHRLEILQRIDFYKPQTGLLFTVGKEYLEKFIRDADNSKASFVDALMRLFSPQGFSEFHYQDTPFVLEKLGINENQLMKGLNVLKDHDRILEVRHLGEQPLFRLMDPRMQKLHIDPNKVYHYRDVLLKKLEYMAGYVHTGKCREVYLRTYFGETDAIPCGHCDNCILLSNRNERDEHVRNEDVQRIMTLLKQGPKSPDELKSATKWRSGKIKNVVTYMEREKLVTRIEEKGGAYGLK
jgi:ATP-dependent DNA helicase RecQ